MNSNTQSGFNFFTDNSKYFYCLFFFHIISAESYSKFTYCFLLFMYELATCLLSHYILDKVLFQEESLICSKSHLFFRMDLSGCKKPRNSGKYLLTGQSVFFLIYSIMNIYIFFIFLSLIQHSVKNG